jgi:hypothetical protein
MAQNSIFYTRLCKRIKKIENCYLPQRPNPLGLYTQKEEDNIRAYSLLTHAELEYYFEAISVKKVSDALNKWLANKKHNSTILLSLCCFVEHTDRVKNATTLEEKIRQIVGKYREAIKKNNGIKEDNIRSILIPIGIVDADMNRTWLNTLNSFGSTRGEIAHTCASVQTLPNPKDIKDKINNIIVELKDLDLIINALK